MFRKVSSADLWLAEHENTDYNKRRAIRSFKARQVSKSHVSIDIDINAITKKLLTDYKGRLGSGADPQSGKTIDNKIESLSDFMNYAIGQGHYTLSRDNPTDRLKIQNKKARIANTKSYQPFTRDALKILFNLEAYLAKMSRPDVFWAPLLGVYRE